MTIPAFGESTYFDCRENTDSRVVTIPESDESAFLAYRDLFLQNGFRLTEGYRHSDHVYAALTDGSRGIFLNYFGAVRELMLVEEQNSAYFSYHDQPASAHLAPQITQVKLTDYGMSYAIRLSDGRYVVIDGGRNRELDADALFRTLCDGTPNKGTPVIAAWIFTHPHNDHYHCAIGFLDRYGESVTVEKFLFTFPDPDDFEHYPKLAPTSEDTVNASEYANILRIRERIARTGADVYHPHTGQTYRIGDAVFEVLACMDDTAHRSSNINMTSLILRMELGGQTVLWSTDASYSEAQLPQKYGTYLKADILQIPHHGFQCGAASAEIMGYDYIRPRVCLLPASDHTAYTFFCVYREGTRSLMTDDNVDEIITGEHQRTLTLPYTAPRRAREIGRAKMIAGLQQSGATSWVFSDLCTACPEDFEFSLLNTTITNVTVSIELYFEDPSFRITCLRTTVPKYRLMRLNILGEDVDRDAVPYSNGTLKCERIPENVPFSVRFLSDFPIVVSHKTHPAAYHAGFHVQT